VFNRTEAEQDAKFSWAEVGRAATPTAVRDLWEHRELAPAADGFTTRIRAHGVQLLRVK